MDPSSVCTEVLSVSQLQIQCTARRLKYEWLFQQGCGPVRSLQEKLQGPWNHLLACFEEVAWQKAEPTNRQRTPYVNCVITVSITEIFIKQSASLPSMFLSALQQQGIPKLRAQGNSVPVPDCSPLGTFHPTWWKSDWVAAAVLLHSREISVPIQPLSEHEGLCNNYQKGGGGAHKQASHRKIFRSVPLPSKKV